MDFTTKRATRPPSFNFNLVVACSLRQSDEGVPLNTMAAPRVDRVDLQKDVGAVDSEIWLDQELQVEREAKVAHVLGALYNFFVLNELHSRLADLRN